MYIALLENSAGWENLKKVIGEISLARFSFCRVSACVYIFSFPKPSRKQFVSRHPRQACRYLPKLNQRQFHQQVLKYFSKCRQLPQNGAYVIAWLAIKTKQDQQPCRMVLRRI